MQGQIIRVKGKFKGSNLPKLSDFDTSHLLQEIINHDSCLACFDFTDKSKMTLDGDKIISLIDKKSGVLSFVPTSLALAPTYNPDLFNGRGGVLFNGAQEGGILNFYPSNQAISIDIFAQNTIIPPSNATFFTIASSANNATNALYYRNTHLAGYNGNLNIALDGKAFNKNRYTTVHDYRPGVSPSVSLYFNDVKGVNSQAAANVKPVGKLNLGRWADTSVPNYGYFILGSVFLFDGDIRQDEYLNSLVKEFYSRQYNI